ncbi:MAG: hypothetical protein ACK4TA_06085 [Saprospiraceae bacterium]
MSFRIKHLICQPSEVFKTSDGCCAIPSLHKIQTLSRSKAANLIYFVATNIEALAG